MSIFSAQEVALLTASASEVFAYAQRLDEEREAKQKRASELGKEKLRPGAKLPLEEVYKTLKEMRPTTLQMLGNKLAAVEAHLKAGPGLDFVNEFAALQTFVYDGLKASLPTDRALLFPQELGAYMCELLEQHRRVYYEVKRMVEGQVEITPTILPKLLSIFPFSKLKELFKSRIESDLRSTFESAADVPGVLSLFQSRVEKQQAVLSFPLLGEAALELWQCFDFFLAEKLRPVIEGLNLQEFADACGAVRRKLNALQAMVNTTPSVTKINFVRAFVKTVEVLDTVAMSRMVDLAELLESHFAEFVAETSREPPDLKIAVEGRDVDIEASEAMVEGLDSAVSCIKPQISPSDISLDSDSEVLISQPSSTHNPDAVYPNPTKLDFSRSSADKPPFKLSAKEIPSMVKFMGNFQLSVTMRLALVDTEWEKQRFAVISLDDLVWEEFQLESSVVKLARVIHGSDFCWPKRVTSALKRLVEAIDRSALLACSNEALLRTLCSNLTTQINAVLSQYEGDKQQQLYRMHPIKALALDISSLVVLRARQEQLYTLLRLASRQALAEEVYVLSHLKQQRTQSALLQLLDSKMTLEMSLLLTGLDSEQWQDPRVRYTSKGVDQPSYAVSATYDFLQRMQSTLEKILHRETAAVVIARAARFWAAQLAIKYCSQIKPSRTRLSQYLRDLETLHIMLLDEFKHLCDMLDEEETEGVVWEVFLALRVLWQALHMFFLTSYLLKLPSGDLQRVVITLQETNAFQPELEPADWPLPSVLQSCSLNMNIDLCLHVREAPEAPASLPDIQPSASNSYFSDVISREFHSAFALFSKARAKYPGKYTIFHILMIFCLAEGNAMKEQLEKSLPIMFQNRAKAFHTYEEMVLHENNLRDFFIFPVTKLIAVVRRRSEMLDDPYPPLTPEEQAGRATIESLLDHLQTVEPGSPSADESLLQSPS